MKVPKLVFVAPPRFKLPAPEKVTAPPVASKVPSTLRVPVEIVVLPSIVAPPVTLIVLAPTANTVLELMLKLLLTVVEPAKVFVLDPPPLIVKL